MLSASLARGQTPAFAATRAAAISSADNGR